MNIRNSAKAIVIQDKKLLVCKLHDQDGVFYLLPGGRQEPGESLDITVKRECLEETGYEIDIKDIVFVRECFRDKKVHRVEFMFRCDLIGKKLNYELNLDANQYGIEWIEINSLVDQPLYPEDLRRKIIQLYANENTKVYLGDI
jgi:ADP-ribose pyrophosphatase YjhB (NUDIX family)